MEMVGKKLKKEGMEMMKRTMKEGMVTMKKMKRMMKGGMIGGTNFVFPEG